MSLFLSGTAHAELKFGQGPAIKTEHHEQKVDRKRPRDNDWEENQKVPVIDYGTASLAQLMDAGYVRPGTGNVTVAYKGMTYRANLLPGGVIEFEGNAFTDPSAFSIHVKRLLSPYKEGDDGWRSVHVDGASLMDYRYKHARAVPVAAVHPSEQGVVVAADLTPDALPVLPSAVEVHVAAEAGGEGEGGEAADPDTANWVQCAKCQAWRVVPDEFWPDIDAAGDEDWFCNEAMWDVSQYEPFTEACK